MRLIITLCVIIWLLLITFWRQFITQCIVPCHGFTEWPADGITLWENPPVNQPVDIWTQNWLPAAWVRTNYIIAKHVHTRYITRWPFQLGCHKVGFHCSCILIAFVKWSSDTSKLYSLIHSYLVEMTIGEFLQTSLFTFLLICIVLYVQKETC